MMDSALQLESLESGYGEVQVLWGISFEVERGKLYHDHRYQWRRQDYQPAHHHGQSACVERPSAAARETRHALSPHAKANRGLVLVPEGRQLFPDMSVEENLEMGGYSKRARKRRNKPGTRLYPVPTPERTPPAEVFHALRRRAADAGHGPRLDAGAGGADDR